MQIRNQRTKHYKNRLVRIEMSRKSSNLLDGVIEYREENPTCSAGSNGRCITIEFNVELRDFQWQRRPLRINRS